MLLYKGALEDLLLTLPETPAHFYPDTKRPPRSVHSYQHRVEQQTRMGTVTVRQQRLCSTLST